MTTKLSRRAFCGALVGLSAAPAMVAYTGGKPAAPHGRVLISNSEICASGPTLHGGMRMVMEWFDDDGIFQRRVVQESCPG